MSIAETIPRRSMMSKWRAVFLQAGRRQRHIHIPNISTTDRRAPKKTERLARVLCRPATGRTASVENMLSLHDRGAGVYFTVNRTDGAGRKGKNITNIRAVWQEDDDGAAVNFRFSHP